LFVDGTRLFAYPLRPSIVIEAHVPSCSDFAVLVIIYGQHADGTWQTVWDGVADPVAVVPRDLRVGEVTIRAGASFTVISASGAFDGRLVYRAVLDVGATAPETCKSTIASWSVLTFA
jgi:hypothetical protein